MVKTILLPSFLVVVLNLYAQVKTLTVNYQSTIGTFKNLAGVHCKPGNSTQAYIDSKVSAVRTNDLAQSDYYDYTTFYQYPNFNYGFDATNASHYDFTHLDTIIDEIKNLDLDILFRLGVKYSVNNNTIPTEPPLDLNDTTFTTFSEICKHTAMHYNDAWANGKNYDMKYWEVWNEPDGGFWSGTPQQYFNMYKTVSNTMKTYDTSLQIGGPGILSGSVVSKRHDYFHDFLVYCKNNNVPLDFFTWHMFGRFNPYAIKIYGDYTRYVLDSIGLATTKNMLGALNMDLGENNNPNMNTPKASAYLASAYMAAQEAPIDMVYWYRANDFMNLFTDDVNGVAQYTWEGMAFKAINTVFSETPNWISTTGNEVITKESLLNNDTTNFMSIAGKDNSDSVVYVLLSNYNSSYNEIDLDVKYLPWSNLNQIEITTTRIQDGNSYTQSISTVSGDNTISMNINNAAAPSVFLIKLRKKSTTLGNIGVAGRIYARDNNYWNLTSTWSKQGPGGPTCNCVPLAIDSVIIDGYSVTVANSNATVKSVYLTNARGDNAGLYLQNGKKLTLNKNLWVIAENIDKNLMVDVQTDNSNLMVKGNALFQRQADNVTSSSLLLNLQNNVSMTVAGSFTFNYYNASDTESFNEIELADDAILNVGTLSILTDNGADFNFNMYDNSILDVNGNIDYTGINSPGKAGIELNNNALIYIGGNFLRNASPNSFGKFICNDSSTLIFDGTSNQVLSNTSKFYGDNFTYQNVSINNLCATSPQIFTDGIVDINGVLTLIDGNIQTTSSSYVNMGASSSVLGASTQSHIIGPIRKTGSTAFTFPVGNGTHYAPIGISNLTLSSTFEAQYFFVPFSNTTSMANTLSYVSDLEYWQLNRYSGNANCQITLAWDDASVHGISSLASLVVSKFSNTNSKWESQGQASSSGGIGNGVSGSITSSISPKSYNTAFTFGSLLNSVPTILNSNINENEPLNTINVFPNPANSIINIQSVSDEIIEIALFNVLGQLEQIWKGSNTNFQQISIHVDQVGIYQLRVTTKNERIIKPLIIAKR